MMASLLSLYQQDAQSPDFSLAAPDSGTAGWIAAARDYLDSVAARFARSPGVSARERTLATGCLNLAAEVLQLGPAVAAETVHPMELPVDPPARTDGRVTVFSIVLACIGVLNLLLMSAPGIVSVIVMAALFGYLYRDDLLALKGRVGGRRRTGSAWRPGAGLPALDAPFHPQLPAAPLKVQGPDGMRWIESILRRTDAIIRQSEPKPEPPPPVGLKDGTLHFFQDLLEAKLTSDRDYAFNKVARESGQVLSAEGIGIEADPARRPEIFRIDTVADAARAGQLETIRPALMQGARCILPGYAHRFAAPS